MQFSTVYGPGRVWIDIDGRPAQEYKREKGRKKEGSLLTTSCFIEAQYGKTFRVHYSFPSDTRMPFPVEIQLYIDGKLVDTEVSGCDTVQARVAGCFEGYNQEDGKYMSKYRAFSFAKPKTTNASEDEDPLEACSIKVVIAWRYVIGGVDHKEYAEEKYCDALAKKVYEDSKTAIMGVHTVPGRLIQTDSTYVCNCVTRKARDMTEHALVFKYRRRRWLAAERLVESETESDDEGFEIVNVKTRRSAREKAARDRRQKSPSRFQVKREPDLDPLFDDGASMASVTPEPQTYYIDLTNDD